MVDPPPENLKRRLHRTILLGAVCSGASALGLFLARPVAAQFHHSSPWVLPAIAVAVLTVLAGVTLIVLPRLTSRGH